MDFVCIAAVSTAKLKRFVFLFLNYLQLVLFYNFDNVPYASYEVKTIIGIRFIKYNYLHPKITLILRLLLLFFIDNFTNSIRSIFQKVNLIFLLIFYLSEQQIFGIILMK